MADRQPKRPATLALIGFFAVVGLVGVRWWLPWFFNSHEVTASTPAPRPRVDRSVVTVTPTSPVCISGVPIDRSDQVVAFTASPAATTSPPLHITLTAPGYRDRVTAPGGYAPMQPIRAPIAVPPRALSATVCAAPQSGSLALLATDEARTRSLPIPTQNGTRLHPSVALTFYRRDHASIAGEIGTMADRAHVVGTPFLPPWLIAAIVILSALALAPAIAWALAMSLREDAGPEP
jgi:hypothetical protein